MCYLGTVPKSVFVIILQLVVYNAGKFSLITFDLLAMENVCAGRLFFRKCFHIIMD